MFLSSLRQRANLDGKATLGMTATTELSRSPTEKRKTISTSNRWPHQLILESIRRKRKIRWYRVIIMAFTTILLCRLVSVLDFFDYVVSGLLVSDVQLLRQYRREAKTARIKELRDMGIKLPLLDIRSVPSKALTSPFGLLAETLIRTVRRKRQIQQATAWVNATWNDACKHRHSTRSNALETTIAVTSPDWSNKSSIPLWILQPNHDKYYRPLYNVPPTWQVIPFDEANMRMFLLENFPKHIKQYDSALHSETKIQIWSWCALYYLGGIMLDQRVRNVTPLLHEQPLPIKGDCQDDAIALFQPGASDLNHLDLVMFAASPRLPLAHCVIERQAWNMWDALRDQFQHEWKLRSESPDSQQKRPLWKKLGEPCSTASDCCMNLIENVTFKVISASQMQHKPHETLEHQTIVVARKQQETGFRKEFHPGFFCNRCLRNPRYGSFDTCSVSCRSFSRFHCDLPLERDGDPIHLQIATLPNHGNYSIPKIVHQSWPERPEPHRFPELARLQIAWKHSGYDYRFYTLRDARNYIDKHFPRIILDAYDAAIGSLKGGIYADMDVMLETNLNYFLTPAMSFFAPRDVIETFAGDDFCLWNGFFGASPGHPFVVRAAERMINMILKRAHQSDMELDACRPVGRSWKVWKLKSASSMISSSCLLGMAVNDVMGKSDFLAKFEPGWIPGNAQSYSDLGDMLVLMGDREDMGTFRFSDIDRNLIVASTDMVGLMKGGLQTFPRRKLNLRVTDVPPPPKRRSYTRIRSFIPPST